MKAKKRTQPQKQAVEQPQHPPIHQWTHDGDKVLLVKMIGKDRTTGGKEYPVVNWPESGKVKCDDWDATPRCGHGLHAWPWGMFIGDGKDPDATCLWVVLAANPADVVQIDGGKVKVPSCEVVFSGNMAEVMEYTMQGRIAWIVANAQDHTSSSGYRSSAASSGDSSSAASSGDSSSAASSGYSSSAASSGYRSSAASSGDRSSAKVAGKCSIASVCGEDGIVEISPTSIGAVYGIGFAWLVHAGAVILQRWEDTKAKTYPFVTLDSIALGLAEGQTVTVVKGKVQK